MTRGRTALSTEKWTGGEERDRAISQSSGSTFTIDGQVHGSCTDTYLGVQATGLTINGTGLLNGATPSNTSCTAQ